MLGITGGIAAYKAADLCSKLVKAGAHVRVIMTDNATRFISPLTFETLSSHPVCTNLFDNKSPWEIQHVSWAKWADAVVVVPATANILAKTAHGICDDMLSTFLNACSSKPILFAPAMNTGMWNNPITQSNISRLKEIPNITVLPTQTGRLACGDEGQGKMLEPQTILNEIARRLSSHSNLLQGKTVLITSGPTHESIDPVRFITNPSSGLMGKSLAETCTRFGAKKIIFVTGPVIPQNLPDDNPTCPMMEILPVKTASDMLDSVRLNADHTDIFIFAAAVSDYRAKSIAPQKLKKTPESRETVLELIENPDIARTISQTKKPNQITVGFAAETTELENYAKSKLNSKNLDMIVANNVGDKTIGFSGHFNEATCFIRGKENTPVFLARDTKDQIAEKIVRLIVEQFISSHSE